jgi:MFS transporter, SP family, xylose:H+ symportor
MTANPTAESTLTPRSGYGPIILIAVVASLGSLLFGFDTAVIAGANDALEKAFHLTKAGVGNTVAIGILGTIVGVFAVGKPSDWFGRKNMLFFVAICYFVSALGCGLARDWYEFLAARFLGGVAVGATSVVMPIYIAEISPPNVRGRLVMVNQFNIVLGILLCSVSNYVIAQLHTCFPQACSPEVSWRWMLGILAAPSVVFFLLLFTIPESPRGLVMRRRIDDARKTLERLGAADVDGELAAIQATFAGRLGHRQARLFCRAHLRPLFLAGTVAVFNQLTGINAVLYYAPSILSMGGASRVASLFRAIAISGTLFLFTIVAMFLIDRLGRRFLLMIGSVGMAACLGLVAAAFSQGAGAAGQRGGLLLAALIGFVASFAVSQGAVMFVFISEIFPNAVRAKGQSLGIFIHWFMAAVITAKFPVLADKGLAAWVFGFLAAMMVLQLLFAWKIMPETKGTSLEDLGT